jgi:Peptidase family C25
LAVLVACYTGAFDASADCLGEELVLADHGPVAVIAATRVTMPYGNTVLGCELLRACFGTRQPAIGDVVRLAQRRTLEKPAAGDVLRISLDSLAENLAATSNDLAAERREHVWMYQLLGDPLIELRRPRDDVAQMQTRENETR